VCSCRLASLPLIAYKGPKVWNKAVYPDFSKEYFQLLADLLVLGAMTGRQPVIAPVDCKSPWITRNSKARHGIEQAGLLTK
jgi:hypothetical protein